MALIELRALTIRQPYAWAVAWAGKDIENRSWWTKYTGPVAIHAGKAWHADADTDPVLLAAWKAITGLDVLDRSHPLLVRGAVIAVARLPRFDERAWSHGSHACHRGKYADLHPDGPYECSRWARGGATGHGPQSHFLLRDVVPIDPIPAVGRQALWTPSEELAAEVWLRHQAACLRAAS